MPTETFENLPEERKKRFIEAAFDEFILNDYEGASISRMVKKLGFGKGSVYRYFEDKKDLYFYLKGIAEGQKMEMVMPLLRDHSKDFFEMYRSLFKAGLEFMRQEPRYSQFLYNMSRETRSKELGDIMLESKRMAIEAFEKEIRRYQEDKVIRNDISSFLIALMVVEASNVISEYILVKYKDAFDASLKNPGERFMLGDIELDEISNAVSRMLEEGIAYKA
ncbi:MAG: TetR/AcrR family transcriptional regulator [Bacteroidia bacterium]|nr:TetR/AcrR family transcriptional regulator [Bacteroidia bacterium]